MSALDRWKTNINIGWKHSSVEARGMGQVRDRLAGQCEAGLMYPVVLT